MKIAIDARILPTGTGRYVERLLHYLQQIDRDNEYFILLDRTGYERWMPDANNFQKVKADYSMYGWEGQVKLARLLKKLKVDLVHYSFQQTALPYRGKKVITFHDFTQLRFKNMKSGPKIVYGAKQKILERGIRHSIKTAEQVIVPTKFVKKDLIEFYGTPAEKITVTYESADPIETSLRPLPVKNLQNQKFILYVGNGYTHKNLSRLLEAYTLLRSQHPKLQLVFAGKKDAFYERLEQQSKKLNLNNNVHFLGFVSDEELAWLYQKCQAYVFPSLSEGFGLPGLEAMTYGAPVVSSNATCLPEVYGKAAQYFNPEDVSSMTAAIDEVVTDKNLRKELIKAGSQQIEKYSWEHMAKQTLKVYQDVLG